jgi:hypothetical protein
MMIQRLPAVGERGRISSRKGDCQLLRPIRLFGDPVLRTPAEPVTDFDAELRNLVMDLT